MTNVETNTAASVAAQGAHVAPSPARPKKGATRKKKAPKGHKPAKVANTRPGTKSASHSKAATLPRIESKGAKILALLRRPKGATLAELGKLTGWQNHSIRGHLSGAISKKMGLTLESVKREDGVRVYSIRK